MHPVLQLKLFYSKLLEVATDRRGRRRKGNEHRLHTGADKR